ncbi:MAG: hypothetical protein AABW68_02080, partial [archaeon]
SFTRRIEKLQSRRDELSGVVDDAGLEPVPISFVPSQGKADVLNELEVHVLELNKLKNLIGMKLKRLLQEEDLLEHLRSEYGKNVSFKRNTKGGIELQVLDREADSAYGELVESKKRLESLRSQIHEIGDEE